LTSGESTLSTEDGAEIGLSAEAAELTAETAALSELGEIRLSAAESTLESVTAELESSLLLTERAAAAKLSSELAEIRSASKLLSTAELGLSSTELLSSAELRLATKLGSTTPLSLGSLLELGVVGLGGLLLELAPVDLSGARALSGVLGETGSTRGRRTSHLSTAPGKATEGLSRLNLLLPLLTGDRLAPASELGVVDLDLSLGNVAAELGAEAGEIVTAGPLESHRPVLRLNLTEAVALSTPEDGL
jgi:hypothetical protein